LGAVTTVGNIPIFKVPAPTYCTNGVDVLYVTVATLVILKLLALASVIYFAELATCNNKYVLVPVVNGAVGGVNVPV
jgi:hypothetical protein